MIINLNLFVFTMEKEKKLFFRRLKDILDEAGNIPNYDIGEFRDWLLHHSNIPIHLKDDCARRYPIYSRTFIIPSEEYEGKNKSHSKSNFRNAVAENLANFIIWKYPRPPLRAQEQHQVCTNIFHVNAMTTEVPQ